MNLSDSRKNIAFLTSLFYATLNNRVVNYGVFLQLLAEFLELGDQSRDVIGWREVKQ